MFIMLSMTYVSRLAVTAVKATAEQNKKKKLGIC
jgi:hypothetical protein